MDFIYNVTESNWPRDFLATSVTSEFTYINAWNLSGKLLDTVMGMLTHHLLDTGIADTGIANRLFDFQPTPWGVKSVTPENVFKTQLTLGFQTPCEEVIGPPQKNIYPKDQTSAGMTDYLDVPG